MAFEADIDQSLEQAVFKITGRVAADVRNFAWFLKERAVEGRNDLANFVHKETGLSIAQARRRIRIRVTGIKGRQRYGGRSKGFRPGPRDHEIQFFNNTLHLALPAIKLTTNSRSDVIHAGRLNISKRKSTIIVRAPRMGLIKNGFFYNPPASISSRLKGKNRRLYRRVGSSREMEAVAHPRQMVEFYRLHGRRIAVRAVIGALADYRRATRRK